jgi:hypothetical protein
LLIKTNYLTAGNFSRMKLQATIGVNSLEREGIAKASTRFEASLSAVAEYAKTDPDMPAEFSAQLTGLTERLFTVLRDSIKISQFAYDPERTADLYYQVSKGYTASPDLRASWLATLSRFHSEVCRSMTREAEAAAAAKAHRQLTVCWCWCYVQCVE